MQTIWCASEIQFLIFKQPNQIKLEILKSSLQTFSTYTTSTLRLTKPQKIKDIFIRKPDKGNGVVILDRKLYNKTIQEIISDTSKFQNLKEDPTLKGEASLQRFLYKLEKKTFLVKLNMINCILLVLLLLLSMILLKCTNSSLVIPFLNFERLFHL